MLATGHQDGGLSLYDVESGDLTARHAPRFGPITTVSWAEQVSAASAATAAAAAEGDAAGAPKAGAGCGVGLYEARHTRLFVPPAEHAAGGAAAGSGAAAAPGGGAGVAGVGGSKGPDPYDFQQPGAEEAAAWPAAPTSLNVLAAADAGGRLGLWLGGEVQIADVAAAGRAQQGGEEEELADEGGISTYSVSGGCASGEGWHG